MLRTITAGDIPGATRRRIYRQLAEVADGLVGQREVITAAQRSIDEAHTQIHNLLYTKQQLGEQLAALEVPETETEPENGTT